MKKGVFFLSATLSAMVLVLLTVVIILLLGYRFQTADTDRYGTVYYYGTSESGTVYTPDGTMTYYAKKNRLVYENGDVYEGAISRFLPNGSGVYTKADGEVIEGYFTDGVASGTCRVTLTSGNLFEGEIQNGEWMIGTLTLVYDDATETPHGSFVNSRLEGEVTYQYRNGASYIGGYQNGLPHGAGTLTYANGDVYEGEFSCGEMSGSGKYTFADKSVYVGEFAGNLPNGQGSYTYTALNGKSVTVSGTFINGVRIDQPENLTAEGGS